MQHNGMSPRGIVVASDLAGMSEFRGTDLLPYSTSDLAWMSEFRYTDLLPYSTSDLASMGEFTDTKLLVSAAAMMSIAIYG